MYGVRGWRVDRQGLLPDHLRQGRTAQSRPTKNLLRSYDVERFSDEEWYRLHGDEIEEHAQSAQPTPFWTVLQAGGLKAGEAVHQVDRRANYPKHCTSVQYTTNYVAHPEDTLRTNYRKHWKTIVSHFLSGLPSIWVEKGCGGRYALRHGRRLQDDAVTGDRRPRTEGVSWDQGVSESWLRVKSVTKCQEVSRKFNSLIGPVSIRVGLTKVCSRPAVCSILAKANAFFLKFVYNCFYIESGYMGLRCEAI